MNDIEIVKYWKERALAAEEVIKVVHYTTRITYEQNNVYRKWMQIKEKAEPIIKKETSLNEINEVKELLKWLRSDSIAFAAFSFSATKLDGTVCTEDDLIKMWKTKDENWKMKKTIVPPENNYIKEMFEKYAK